MTDKIVEKIDPAKMNEMVANARDRIFLSLPNIHEELAEAVAEASEKVNDIRIIVDFSESTFRNGYGNIKAIEDLKKTKAQLFESPNNRVSFIICDDKAYFIFPESRIFAYDDIGYNAFRIDPLTQISLETFFFPKIDEPIDEKAKTEMKAAERETLKKATKEHLVMVMMEIDKAKAEKKNNIEPLVEEKVNIIKEKLLENPPTHPDLQRQIQVYTAKIQFVELTFEGANLHVMKVSIPPDALPFKDEEIKKLLETKMRLFDNLEQNEDFKDFFSLKEDVEKVRKEYCAPVKTRKNKSVIDVQKKVEFLKQLNDLNEKIENLNKSIPIKLDQEILKSKIRIQKELGDFLIAHPPEELNGYQQNLLFNKIDDIVYGILNSIKYPDPKKIVDRISLKENFYDLTFEDFKDDEFLKELVKRNIMEKGDIDAIVTFRDAFNAKEPNEKK